MQTKICSKCKKEKSIELFSKNKSKKSGYSCECKECHKIIRKKYYDNNKEKEINRVHTRRAQQVKDFKEFKSKLKCILCNENHITTLHFHHLNPSMKEIELSTAIRLGWSKDKLEKEIDKCVVLCANCHAKEHYSLNTNNISLIN